MFQNLNRDEQQQITTGYSLLQFVAEVYFFVAECHAFLKELIMEYSVYQRKFVEAAKAANKTDDYIAHCLDYSRPLLEKGLPVIYDVEHFSNLVGVKPDYLYIMANAQNQFYRRFRIPKNNGKSRLISAPLPLLKDVQTFILENILCKIPCHPCAKAYIKKKSLKDNAKFHRNQEKLLKIDLADYFPSLSSKRVYAYFISLGYSKALCSLFSGLCTLSGSLPQGAPTSPYLSNLLTMQLDQQLFELCQDNGTLRYTRYADDISISGSFDARVIIPKVYKIIRMNGLLPNTDKTHVIGQHMQQNVTGIVVNKRVQVPKNYRKKIRLEMYYITKFGLSEHLSRSLPECSADEYVSQLLGRISYCLQINPKDNEMRGYKETILSQK